MWIVVYKNTVIGCWSTVVDALKQKIIKTNKEDQDDCLIYQANLNSDEPKLYKSFGGHNRPDIPFTR